MTHLCGSFRVLTTLTLAALTLAGCAAPAPEAPPAAVADNPPATPAAPATPVTPAGETTAQVRPRRRVPEPILPLIQRPAEPRPEPPTDGLPEDGVAVTLRGRLGPHDASLYRRFLCADATVTARPRLLPNGYLQRMERIEREAGGADDAGGSGVDFEITGEATRYRDGVYILVARAVALRAQADSTPDSPAAPAESADAGGGEAP